MAFDNLVDEERLKELTEKVDAIMRAFEAHGLPVKRTEGDES